MREPKRASEPGRGVGPRGVVVLLAVTLAVAGAGYVTGLVSVPEPQAPSMPAKPSVGPGVRPPMSYAQLRGRPAARFFPVSSDLVKFQAGLPKHGEPVVPSPEARALALATRALRRQYDGAPPVIPHATDAQSVGGCPACHDQGGVIGNTRIPVMSHPRWSQCTQCHASVATSAVATLEEVERPLGNGFEGLSSPGPGARAWHGAPPTVPHALASRTNCTACHGLTGIAGLRTSHPERHNCLQ
jgi:cytochrome c-type protein NapB